MRNLPFMRPRVFAVDVEENRSGFTKYASSAERKVEAYSKSEGASVRVGIAAASGEDGEPEVAASRAHEHAGREPGTAAEYSSTTCKEGGIGLTDPTTTKIDDDFQRIGNGVYRGALESSLRFHLDEPLETRDCA